MSDELTSESVIDRVTFHDMHTYLFGGRGFASPKLLYKTKMEIAYF